MTSPDNDGANAPRTVRARIMPWLRLLVVFALFAMLFFVPTREFLKLTFMLGIPLLLGLVLMRRQPRRNILWAVGLALSLAVFGFYLYSLTDLPQRVAVRYVVMEGASLKADGRYDEAIAVYNELYDLDRASKADREIAHCEAEKAAQQGLERVSALLEAGDAEAARAVIQDLPEGTRAQVEAQRMLRQWEKQQE